MKFDNTNAVIRVQMQKRLLAVVVVTFIAIYFTTNIWRYVEGLIGLPKVGGILFFVSIFLIFYIYHIVAASAFIFYNDEEGKIILRFYQINMFNSSKNSVEIPKSEFEGYSLKSGFMGIRKSITLYRKYQGKTVKYPPASISLLTEAELNKLQKSLREYGPLLT